MKHCFTLQDLLWPPLSARHWLCMDTFERFTVPGDIASRSWHATAPVDVCVAFFNSYTKTVQYETDGSLLARDKTLRPVCNLAACKGLYAQGSLSLESWELRKSPVLWSSTQGFKFCQSNGNQGVLLNMKPWAAKIKHVAKSLTILPARFWLNANQASR